MIEITKKTIKTSNKKFNPISSRMIPESWFLVNNIKKKLDRLIIRINNNENIQNIIKLIDAIFIFGFYYITHIIFDDFLLMSESLRYFSIKDSKNSLSL